MLACMGSQYNLTLIFIFPSVLLGFTFCLRIRVSITLVTTSKWVFSCSFISSLTSPLTASKISLMLTGVGFGRCWVTWLVSMCFCKTSVLAVTSPQVLHLEISSWCVDTMWARPDQVETLEKIKCKKLIKKSTMCRQKVVKELLLVISHRLHRKFLLIFFGRCVLSSCKFAVAVSCCLRVENLDF